MTGVLFADTSYWLALLNRRDHLHAKALRVLRSLASTRIVSSEMVFAELLNGLSADAQLRAAAIAVVRGLRDDLSLSIVPQSPEQFAAAFHRYARVADKDWSLTDCASFLIMEERGIRSALTHDHHFVQAGFEALLR